MVRNTANANNFLSQGEVAFQIRKSITGVQNIIGMSMKHYEETKDLNALKVAFDGYCSLNEMLKQVEGFCSYGDFELTK